jgi:hypothetical protein
MRLDNLTAAILRSRQAAQCGAAPFKPTTADSRNEISPDSLAEDLRPSRKPGLFLIVADGSVRRLGDADTPGD